MNPDLDPAILLKRSEISKRSAKTLKERKAKQF